MTVRPRCRTRTTAPAGRDRHRERVALGRAAPSCGSRQIDLGPGDAAVDHQPRGRGSSTRSFTPTAAFGSLVKEYPKDKEYRRFKASSQLIMKIEAHVTGRADSRDDDLLFATPRRPKPPEPTTPVQYPTPSSSDSPNPTTSAGSTATVHLPAYNAGKCRCQHCKDAFAIYRAARRAVNRVEPA